MPSETDNERFIVPIGSPVDIGSDSGAEVGYDEEGQAYLTIKAGNYSEAVSIAEDRFGAETVGPHNKLYRSTSFTQPLTETYGEDVPAIILGEEHLNTPYGKTARGVLMHSTVFDSRAVIDSSNAGSTVGEVVEREDMDHLEDVPVVGSFEAAKQRVPEAEAFVVGVATEGGYIPDGWNEMIIAAIKDGQDIFSGLHTYIGNQRRFAKAAESGARIYDVRKSPDPVEFDVAEGAVGETDATIVYIAGTDCAVGKRTTAADLTRIAEEAGYNAEMVATGQTGILLGHPGVAVDAVVMDFASGALEKVIHETAKEHDIVFVEGQGSVMHPAWVGTHIGLRAAHPDAVVVADEPEREHHIAYGDEQTPIDNIEEQIEAIERHGRTTVAAISTWADSPGEAYSDTLPPAANVFKEGGARKLLRAVEEAAGVK